MINYCTKEPSVASALYLWAPAEYSPALVRPEGKREELYKLQWGNPVRPELRRGFSAERTIIDDTGAKAPNNYAEVGWEAHESSI